MHWTLFLSLVGCNEPSAGSASAPPSPVVSAEVRLGTLEEVVELSGEVRAPARATLAAAAGGPVDALLVREGDAVQVGDLLAKVLDDLPRAQARAAASAAQEAEVQARLARIERERLERVDVSVLAPLERERAEALAEAAEARAASLRAQADLARAELARHTLRAPFAGVVLRRLADPGDWVQPGEALLELVAAGDPEVLLQAPADLLARLSPGMDARLVPSGLPGTVLAVAPALDPATRTGPVRVAAPGGVPGRSVQVAFALRSPEGLVVPRDAVLRAGTEDRVVKVVEGKAEPTAVTILVRGTSDLLVQGEGLGPGDRVVIRGNERLKAGQSVQEAGP